MSPRVLDPPAPSADPAPPRARREPDPASVERRTQQFGRLIFRRLRRHENRALVSRERAEKLMLGVLMKDEELKYRMLRFVDVYSTLRTPSAIARHLDEYLTSDALSLGRGTGVLTTTARLVGRARGVTEQPIAWASRFGIRTVGQQFIAGDNPRTVAPRILAMERQGFHFSLDLLGEFVVSEAQADEFQRRYLEMIEGLAGLIGPEPRSPLRKPAGPRVNISIKLSSLASKFDPMDPEGTTRTVLGRLRPLFRAAAMSGAFINIDMEKFEYRDLTIEIIQALLSEEEFRGFDRIGTVLQAYLVDAEEVLASLLCWLRERRQPMTLRLVKGAYWDSEQIWARQRGWPVPVLTDKRETDAQYERMTRTLLENHDLVRTAIASHNVRSIARGLALRQALRVPPDRLEIQMLYGMAGPIAHALLHMGLPVRVYVPCGELIPGMAYLVRRILENTANDSFLRQRFTDHKSESLLLADPATRPSTKEVTS